MGLTLKQWTPAVDQWIYRLNRLAQWCPELGLPAIGDEDRLFLLQQICLGSSYSAKEIRDKPVWPWLKDWLSAGQEALMDQYAPEHRRLPSGRRGRIRYAADAPPVLSARIQDLYDLNQTPAIAMDRQPLVVEVLGPNQRPLQVTQDLPGFWQTTYPELKKKHYKNVIQNTSGADARSPKQTQPCQGGACKSRFGVVCDAFTGGRDGRRTGCILTMESLYLYAVHLSICKSGLRLFNRWLKSMWNYR